MANRTEQFRKDMLESIADVLQRVDLNARSDNEVEAYINRLAEDLTHDLDRFSRDGLKGTVRGQLGATEREVALRGARVERAIISILSQADTSRMNDNQVRDLQKRLETEIPRIMEGFGMSFGFFAGETDDNSIARIINPSDWLIQHTLVLLKGFRLGDLTGGETRELHKQVSDIVDAAIR